MQFRIFHKNGKHLAFLTEWSIQTASKHIPEKSLQWPEDKPVQIKAKAYRLPVFSILLLLPKSKQAVTLATMSHFAAHMPLWTNTLNTASPCCMFLSIMFSTALCRSPTRSKTHEDPSGSCWAGQTARQPSAVFHTAPQANTFIQCPRGKLGLQKCSFVFHHQPCAEPSVCCFLPLIFPCSGQGPLPWSRVENFTKQQLLPFEITPAMNTG